MYSVALVLLFLLAACTPDAPQPAPLPLLAAPTKAVPPHPVTKPIAKPKKSTGALPGDAVEFLPQLSDEIATFWTDLDPRTFPAGVIEQESGWKLHAQLKTSRELGCGLGQFTKAFNADGSVRFDALTESKKLDPSLAGWSWQDCYIAKYQLRATVLKLKSSDRECAAQLHGALEIKACDAAKYNGGSGSVSKRIRMCRTVEGCDSTKWFGNLETQCAASNVRVKGYGESFCQINSKYPARVFERMPKYESAMSALEK